MLLIIGGSQDHNIECLADAALRRGDDYRLIHTDISPVPAVAWQPGSTDIAINGETFSAKGTSLFIRYDVFGDSDADVQSALYDTFKGWALSCPEVKLLNRRNETLEVNKPRALLLASQCGFDVPQTWITSDFNKFADKDRYIAKPVSGGAYTKRLSDMAAQPGKSYPGKPYIVQPKLEYPELRIFRAGHQFLAFHIHSEELDYRTTHDCLIRPVPVPPALEAAMRKLTDKMGLDYAAADLKTDPETRKLLFLEVNTMPMLTGYDRVVGGKLSEAICHALQKPKTNTKLKLNTKPKALPRQKRLG